MLGKVEVHDCFIHIPAQAGTPEQLGVRTSWDSRASSSQCDLHISSHPETHIINMLC